MGSSIKTIEDKLSHLQKKGESVKIGAALGKSFQDLKAETLRVRQEYEKTGYKNAELGNRLRALQRATREAGREAQKYGFELGKAAKQTKYLETMSAQAEARVGRMQARMARKQERGELLGKLKWTVGTGVALGATLRPAIAFEETFAGLRKVRDMSDAEAERMKRNLLDISTRIPMTGEALTQIAVSAAQMGIKSEQSILNFTAAAAKMGVAFDIPAEEAGRAMAEIRNSSGLTQEQVLQLGDAINHLSDNTAGKAPQIVEFMRRVGGAGKIAGIAPEKLAALGTAFDAAGVAPERSARAVNDLVMRLSRVNGESKSVRAAFQAMGYDTAELQKRMLVDPNGTILEFLERAGRQKNVLASLSGTIGAGFADEIAMVVGNVDKYREALDLVSKKSNYAGSMQREFENRSKTAANSLQLLRNQVNRIAVTVGSVFLPHVAEGAKALGNVVGKFARWATENPKTIKLIGSIIAGFIGMKAAFLVGRIGLSHMIDGFSLLNDGFQMIRPSTIQAVFGLIKMKGVGGVVAGLLGPLSKLKGGFLKDVGAIRSAAKFVGTSFLSVGKGVATGFKLLGSGLLSFVKIIGVGIKAVGTAMMANPVILAIGVVIALVAGAVYLIWKHWDKVKVWLGAFWEGIKTRWSGAIKWIGKTVSGIGEAIKAPFVAAFEWIGSKIDWIRSKWEGFKSVFSFGSSAAIGGPNGNAAIGTSLPGHAIGGVFDREHVAAFSEGNKEEAVIAFEGDKDRARSIWTYSGAKLGMFNGGRTSGTETPSRSVYIAPGAIQVNAAPGMDESALADEVLRRLERIIKQRQGRSYSDVAFAR